MGAKVGCGANPADRLSRDERPLCVRQRSFSGRRCRNLDGRQAPLRKMFLGIPTVATLTIVYSQATSQRYASNQARLRAAEYYARRRFYLRVVSTRYRRSACGEPSARGAFRVEVVSHDAIGTTALSATQLARFFYVDECAANDVHRSFLGLL
jgi:hypothetical protein